ncbi:zinc-binding dehydrogenase [Novosphingopyxis sp. YJ-S2-01]|uniref:zinc-binding dehydrogenase n=1 Tax=Novosphingopyxis sp. YJ-S2-01 TaxID=2794021 RepID=UPI0018DC6A91|nr:zinc-binding dehydrogenase [Novosphingopyxis sp. YJ-S2-01]MBH9538605.1 zinc-binding dehydrogenase [Novosphingopyxis sp. YJ-S2-01]
MSDHQGLELRSTITEDGKLKLNLEQVDVGAPAADEVVVRVEAAPINPSDLGLLLGPAKLSTMEAGGSDDRPEVTADLIEGGKSGVKARIGQSMPVGNEGAGTVVAAGEDVQDMMGKQVGMMGGAMYAQYRKVKARECIVLPEDASAEDGASMFVNPLTSLAFTEQMKMDGFKALVHTAAASNLGQMLNKICLADGIPLVNIVRKEEQVKILKDIGAPIVINSSEPDFMAKLTDAIAETEAYLAFDAVGGGKLAGHILNAMEAASQRSMSEYSRYGSDQAKQVYLYGVLDTSPTVLERGFGMAWSIGGWLLPHFLGRAGQETAKRMRQRVKDELKTTFASHYTQRISLAEALQPDTIRAYQSKSTGEKYLIVPTK